MTDNEKKELIKESYSINDLSKKIYGYCNGRTVKNIKKFILKTEIDISHFDEKNKNRKYDIIKKECPVCGKEFETQKNQKEKETCSIGCSNIYFRSNKTTKERNKISNSLINFYKENDRVINKIVVKYKNCCICGDKFERWRIPSGNLTKSKTCSDKCGSKLRSSSSKIAMKKLISEGKHKGWLTRDKPSYPERFFSKILSNRNLLNECETEYKVKHRDLGIDSDYCYFLDFYFPDKKLDLEIDGKQHEREDRKKSDEIRDMYLKENGIDVYRIKWRSINNNIGKKYIKEEIGKFLEYYNSK